MLRAVIFDLDDTLIPEAAAVRASLAATCEPAEERLGLPPGSLSEMVAAVGAALFASLGGDRIDARFGVTWEECLWGRFGTTSQRQIPGLRGAADALRHRLWSDALAALGASSPLLPGELDARYPAERRRRLRPFPEAEPLLDALRDRALLLGCVTNGASEVQREKLEACGLVGAFDEVLVSGEEGIGKPDPAILLRACERLGVRPEEAVYVGNSPVRDVAAARAAGMRSVLVERRDPDAVAEPDPLDLHGRGAEPQADRVVYEVHGLLGLVDGWRRGRAFLAIDPERRPIAIDEPAPEGDRYVARIGGESDELRPAVRGASPRAALEAGFRSLRARAGSERWCHELGEPVDWDAILR